MRRATRQRSTIPLNQTQRSSTAHQPPVVPAARPSETDSQISPNEQNHDRNKIDQIRDDCCTKSILGGLACAGVILAHYYACRNSNKCKKTEEQEKVLKKTIPLTLLAYGTGIIFRLYYKTAKSTHQE